MSRPSSIHPTELELQILQILWRRAPLPVAEVRRALASGAAQRQLAHTSVITTLNIMVRKRYLRRTRDGRAYLYQPCVARTDVTGQMLGDMVDRVFDGSATAVMLNLLENADIDQDELTQLRELINRKTGEEPI